MLVGGVRVKRELRTCGRGGTERERRGSQELLILFE